MADTTKELLTLEPDTPCRVRGVVKRVFDIASGESKHGTWYRQDFILQDDEGEVKVGWFNPGPTVTMSVLHGAEVQVMGEVNRYTTKNKEARTAIKASGESAVKPLDGNDFSQEASKPSTSDQKPRSFASNHAMTDREWMAWAGGILPQLVDLYEYGSEGDVTQEAVIEAAQATLVHLSIRHEKGSVQLTYGMLAEEEKAKEEPEGEGGENVPDDDDLPF